MLGWVTACAVLCVICYVDVDRPVAAFAGGYIVPHEWVRLMFQAMASPSLFTLPLSLGYLILLALKLVRGRPMLVQAAVATMAATAAKDTLKWLIGRPWPETWLARGIYGFQPFNTSSQFGSFPSGHTSYMAAPLFIIAHYHPQLRWPCYGVIGMVMLGLVGGGYHFPGDTIAGLLTGMLAAGGTLALMRGKAG